MNIIYLATEQTISAAMNTDESTVLKWAFDHSSDGMLITDTHGVIQKVNDAFVHMFGFQHDEIVGQRTNFLRSAYSTSEFYQEMWRSLSERNEWKGEIINRTKNGQDKTCFLTITSIKSPEGKKLGYLGVEIDLTERKKLEDQIVHGEKLAMIGESLATVMHEIRNPLNGIAMNIFLLEQSAEEQVHWTEDERESIHLIGSEVKRLEGLVKSAISYGRTLELNTERVMLDEFFSELRDILIYDADRCKVSLEIEPTLERLSGYFDPALMKQVMLNLIQNAIDAAAESDQRMVRVSAASKEHTFWQPVSASGRVLLLSVENSGQPIRSDVAKNLFKPFFTTKGHGLGLGLATSAKIVRQHHGIINHANAEEPPFTTIFTVAVPA